MIESKKQIKSNQVSNLKKHIYTQEEVTQICNKKLKALNESSQKYELDVQEFAKNLMKE